MDITHTNSAHNHFIHSYDRYAQQLRHATAGVWQWQRGRSSGSATTFMAIAMDVCGECSGRAVTVGTLSKRRRSCSDDSRRSAPLLASQCAPPWGCRNAGDDTSLKGLID